MATIIDISHETVRQHLIGLGKFRREGIWIPKQLTATQLKNRLIIASSLLTHYEKTPFLRDNVSGDEKWVLYVM